MTKERQYEIRMTLWGLSALILQTPDLEEFEDEIYYGEDTPADDLCLVSLSRIYRKVREKLVPIEEKLHDSRPLHKRSSIGSAFSSDLDPELSDSGQKDIFQ